MSEIIDDPAVIIALIAVIPGVISFLGTIVLGVISMRNTSVSASEEIARGTTEMLSNYRMEVESLRKELNDVNNRWEKKYLLLENRYNNLYNDHAEVVLLNDRLTERVRYLEDRLDTGPLKEK